MTASTPADPTDEILRAACARSGLEPAGAEVLRRGENVIYRLPTAVIVRISRSGQLAAAQREVQVARWLEVSGVAAVRVVSDIEQPITVADRPVTFWRELPPHRDGTSAEVAAALRKLHLLPLPTEFDPGKLDPFVRLDDRIAAASTISPDDRDWMHRHLIELRQRWADVPTGLPWCLIHGDAWVGNIVATDRGEIVLLDLERSSIGPPEWDTVHTAIKYQTLGEITAEEYEKFCEIYCSDVMEWPGYELLRDLREFRMTTMAAQAAVHIPADRPQADHRIACLRGRNGPRPWSGWWPVPSR